MPLQGAGHLVPFSAGGAHGYYGLRFQRVGKWEAAPTRKYFVVFAIYVVKSSVLSVFLLLNGVWPAIEKSIHFVASSIPAKRVPVI